MLRQSRPCGPPRQCFFCIRQPNPALRRGDATARRKPDSAGEKPDQGEVIAVGPGKRDEAGRIIALDVKVGDRVLFGKYSGQTVKVDGEELLVMREEDIMGILA